MAHAPLGFDIQTKGDEQAAQLVYQLARRGEDPRPAFRQILDELRVAEDAWFESHGRGTWPPLAEATREIKAKRGQSQQPLVATGALRRSLEVKRGRGATRSATKTRMRFGTTVWYARFHYFVSHSVPQRIPLIILDQRARRRMVLDVRNYMLGRTNGKAT